MMEKSMLKKIATIGAYIGILVITFGLLNYSINEVWDIYSTIMVSIGGVLVVFGLVMNLEEAKKAVMKRSTAYSANAFVMTVIFVAIVVLVNFLSNRHGKRLDFTENKEFSLSDQTVKVLENLNKDVKVVSFYKAGEEQRMKDLLDNYSYHSSKLKYEFIDPDKKPEMAKRYDIKAYGTTVIETSGKSEKISEISEEKLTNAIVKATREKNKIVYFTSGHGERDIDNSERDGYQMVKEELEKLNYSVKKLNIITTGIPEDCSVLIIAGPKNNFFPNEIDSLKNYLDKGGKAFFMIDPPPSANFSELLDKWGIKIDEDIIVDYSGIGRLFGMGPEVPLVSEYESHAITEKFDVMTFYPMARSVSKKENVESGISVQTLFKTNPRSWGETDITGMMRTGQVSNDNKDLAGPLSIGAISTKDNTKIVVFGDSDFAANIYAGQSGNGNLFLNVVNYLAEESDLIAIKPKDPEDRRVTLTAKQGKMIFWLTLVIMPVSVIATGVVVYFRRRK
jgi:ABC-type uncharacterized transport system involved in gliding motility auxiliary subunit